MDKQAVISALGKPDETSTAGPTEYLSYGWDSPWDGRVDVAEWYYVRLINGKVESFGRKGDFNSTKDPTLNINQSVTSRDVSTPDLYTKLQKLKSMKEEGLITEEEFNKLKAEAISASR